VIPLAESEGSSHVASAEFELQPGCLRAQYAYSAKHPN